MIKKLLLALVAVSTLGTASNAATLFVTNHTAGWVEAEVTYIDPSVEGPEIKHNHSANAIRKEIFLNNIATVKTWIDFFRPTVVELDLTTAVTDQGYKVESNSSVHINYWQQAPGYFVATTDVYDVYGNFKGKLN